MTWTNHKAALSLMYNGPQRLFTISYNVGYKPTKQERVDISNLVGAAPQLLEALEEAEKLLSGPIAGLLTGDSMSDSGAYDVLYIIRSAIQRAKGEQ